MPFIKPPAAETASHGSSQHGWGHHLGELHPRAEGRRLARSWVVHEKDADWEAQYCSG